MRSRRQFGFYGIYLRRPSNYEWKRSKDKSESDTLCMVFPLELHQVDGIDRSFGYFSWHQHGRRLFHKRQSSPMPPEEEVRCEPCDIRCSCIRHATRSLPAARPRRRPGL